MSWSCVPSPITPILRPFPNYATVYCYTLLSGRESGREEKDSIQDTEYSSSLQRASMWWSNAAKLIPFLLASSLDTRRVSPPRPHDDTTPPNAVATVKTITTPQTPSDLSRDFFSVYQDLGQPGPIFKQVTPTLRFSYVTPTINGKSTWSTIVDVPEELKPSAAGTKKPIGLYLPGLDGYGISAFRNQFDDLADNFELWRLTIQPDDRSPFTEIVQVIAKFVEDVAADADGRPIVLIGESCGGLLAAAVSLRLQREQKKSNTSKSPLLQGLVLVNPATSFEQTNWDTLVPIMASLDTNIDRGASDSSNSDDLNAYEVVGSLLLSYLVPDGDQMRRILDAILGLPELDFPLTDPDQIQEIMKATVEGFKGTGEKLPGDMLKHRVNWLAVGAPLVNARLPELDLQTLVLVGKEDKLMPSASEGDRLVRTLPKCEKLEVSGRGHFVLDENVNLTEAILFSKIDPMKWKETKKKYDIVLDWKIPRPEKIASVIESSVKPFRIAHSPVFMSTDKNRKRWMGLSKVPRQDGPVLFVANHQYGKCSRDVR
jgi:pimeloyl-ACP methyl ester carboxylesterase